MKLRNRRFSNYQQTLFNKYEIDESYLQTKKQRRACMELLEKVDKKQPFDEKRMIEKIVSAFQGSEFGKKLTSCVTVAALLITLQSSPAMAQAVSSFQSSTEITSVVEQPGVNSVVLDDDSFLNARKKAVQREVKNTSINMVSNKVLKNEYEPMKSNGALIDEDSDVSYYSKQEIKTLTVIDTSIEDWEVVRDAVKSGEILLLEGDSDPLDAILEKIEDMKQVDCLNIVSHGSTGKLNFKNGTIDSSLLDKNKNKWANISKYLSTDGDIQLFGCNIAKGDEGKDFITKLAEITGADVAASINPTGAEKEGGDWTLEAVVGDVVGNLPFTKEAISKFLHLLELPTGIVPYNFSTFTDNHDTLNSTYFTVSTTVGGSQVPIQKTITSALTYGTYYNIGFSFKVEPHGTELASFELEDINLNNVYPSSFSNIQIIGYKDGAAVASSNPITLNAYQTVTYSNFTFNTNTNFDGKQLDYFIINAFAPDSNYGTIGLRFNSFTVSNMTAPAPANTAPSITSGDSASFAENGTGTVYTATGTDPNAGDSLTWSISGTDASLFSINSSTGVLSFNTAPNYENPADSDKNNTYNLTITATDKGSLTATKNIAITVTNVNDAPTITSAATASFAEGGTGTVYTATGSDQDGNSITWSLAGGADLSKFSIDSSTGVLTFNTAPNYESPVDSNGDNAYEVVIQATDNGTGTMTSTKAVTVTVTNVNEAPSITSGASASFTENGTATVYTATGTDPENGTLTWSITGGADADKFNINSSTGVLTFKNAPNYESPTDADVNNTYAVTLQVSDGMLTATKAIAISVTNANDAPTITSAATASFAEGGTGTVYTATGSDQDSNSITWSIAGGADSTRFSIDSSTGVLTFNTAPDYESPVDSNGDNAYEVIIQATDNGIGTMTSTKAVTVTVTNVNEAPSITSGALTSFIENGTGTVYTATGTDPENGTLTWSIAGGADADKFNINSSTGVLTFKNAPNYESPTDADVNNTYAVTLQVSDGMLTATKAIAISVTNANDAPTITSAATASFTEGGTGTVYTATGSDQDSNSITWSIAGGADSTRFSIDSSTGVLTFNTAPDYESPVDSNGDNAYEVVIQATDNGIGTMTSTKAVTVTVTNVNEAPSITSGASASFTENGTGTVYTATGTDPENGTLTWSIAGGADADKFNINSSTGVLTFKNAPNYESPTDADVNNTYAVTVQVSDGMLTATKAIAISVTNVNDAPTVANSTKNGTEDTTLTFSAADITGLFGDAEGDSLNSIQILTLPDAAIGVLKVGGTDIFAGQVIPAGSLDTITFVPAANFNGNASFTWKASDGTADSAVATMTLAIAGVNDAPTTANHTFTTGEDTVITNGSLVAYASDVDAGTTLAYSLVSGASHGTVVVNSNGTFTYTPEPNFNGSDSFTWKVSDGTAESNVATVTIIVNAVNDAPIVQDHTFTTNEDMAITNSSLTAYASDVDAATTLTYSLVSGTSHGTVVLNSTGTFTYTPEANFNGSDSFTWRVSDGTAYSNTATVTITVNSINDIPTAAAHTFTTNEDTILNGSLTAYATDVDGDTLTYAKVSDSSHGTVTVNEDGTFTYTPAANYNGSDSFTWSVSDGIATAVTATATITVNAVNDEPTVANSTKNGTEDTTLTFIAADFTGVYNDTENQVLSSIQIVTLPDASHGVLKLGGTDITVGQVIPAGSLGTITFVPAANFNGNTSFTWKASDGTDYSEAATMTLAIAGVNDAPTAAAHTFTTNEDTAITNGSLTAYASDVDEGTTLTYSLVSGASHGTLEFNSAGTFTYTPEANFNGSDSFTWKVSDGTAESNVATVTIIVNAVNDAPIVQDHTFTTNEDMAITNSSLTAYASDVDAATTLTYSLVSGTSHGTVVLNSTGTFTYTPEANFNGSDSFTWRVSDGTAYSNTATVTITINSINDIPTAAAHTFTTNEDTILNGSLTAYATDVDGDTLTYAKVSDPSHGTVTVNGNGTFTYTPAANYNGSDSFTWSVSDGISTAVTATATITVNAVNDAPTVANSTKNGTEDTTLTFIAADFTGVYNDTENQALSSIQIVTLPDASHGVLELGGADITVGQVIPAGNVGSISFVPATNFNGNASFTWKASDGTDYSEAATMTLAIAGVNDVPITAVHTFATDEDTAITNGSLTAYASDVDEGTTLTYSLVSGANHGTLVLNGDGTFTYTPEANFNGSDNFTWSVSDGSSSDTAIATINVNAVNDAPIVQDHTFTTNEDTAITNGSLVAYATDVDAGTTLTYYLVSGTSHGTLALNSDGTFTYTPEANFNGSDSFTWRVSDGTAYSNTATVTITVNSINDIPTAAAHTFTTNEDTAITNGSLTAYATDVDGDTMTYAKVSGPSHGTVTVNGNGTFTYTPAANYNGSDSFTWSVSDGKAAAVNADATIIVNTINDAPIIADSTKNGTEDTTLTFTATDFTGVYSDEEGDSLNSIQILALPDAANGLLKVGGTDITAGQVIPVGSLGSISFVPATNFNGNASFIWKASDGTDDSVAATMTLAIAGVNDVPITAAHTFATDEDTKITNGSLAAYASDVDTGTTLTYSLVIGANHGTLVLNGNGTFTYTPEANFNGTDSFTWKVSDGTAYSNIATATITVSSVNDAPIVQDHTFTTNEDTAITNGSLVVYAADVDIGTTLTYSLVSGTSHGTVVLNSNGTFTYTPEANFNGEDSFTWKVSDSTADSNTATATITVNSINDIPTAAAHTFTTNEDTILNGSLTAYATDVDGDTLTYAKVSDSSHGTVTVNGDGTFTYTPAANYNGSDSFTWSVSDGIASAVTATATITVNAVNDEPTVANSTKNGTEDTIMDFTAADFNGVYNDTENQALSSIQIVTLPDHGILKLGGTDITAGQVIPAGSLGSISFVPDTNFNGSASFIWKASDGTDDSAAATMTLAVAGVNDAPTAAAHTFTTNEDTAITNGSLTDYASDVDEGTTLTYSLVSGANHGTLVLNGDGTFTYTPEANFNGSDNFTWSVSDGSSSDTAIATINVNAVNDAPTAVAHTFVTDEDSAITNESLAAYASDVDAATTLTYSLVSGTSHGTLVLNSIGTFTYTPEANFNGSDSFTWRVSDGTAYSNTATVTITINSINDIPTVLTHTFTTDEDTILNGSLTAYATDVDGDTLTYAKESDPSHGTVTVNGNGTFTYTPAANYYGSDSFTWSVSDGIAQSNTTSAAITINPVNDAPTAADSTKNGTEDTVMTFTAADFSGVYIDTESEALSSIKIVTLPEVTQGVLKLSDTDIIAGQAIPIASISDLTFVPVPNFNGNASFTWKASDGTVFSAVPSTMTLSIANVNDIPNGPTNVNATAGDGQVTITFTPPTDNGGSAITKYIVTSEPGGITTEGITNTIIISGLTNGTLYSFKVKAVNDVGTGPESVASNGVTPQRSASSSGSQNSETGIDIYVNGNAEKAASSTIIRDGDRTVAAIAVNGDLVDKKLQSEGNNSVVTISVKDKLDAVDSQLNGQTIKNMEEKEAVLEIKTQNVTYTLPASQIDIDSISDQIGNQVKLQDIIVSVMVSEPPADTVTVIENTADKDKYQIVVQPVQFEITCKSEGKTVEVSKFNAYVERMVAIPEGVDPSKITTGIVLNSDGTFSHVPTQITIIDGKYYAKINSLTNSTYSVIWNSKTFTDVDTHWSEDAVNDMGSRLVVVGTGDGNFAPDRDITRAEFVTILVKGLGLMRNGTGKDTFNDVLQNTWYYDAVSIAYEYGLISGVGNDKFKPMDLITREEAMTIIKNAMNITKLKFELSDDEENKILDTFSDSEESSDWAEESIAACVKAGIIEGRGSQTLAPNDQLTRAEATVIVRKLLQKSKLI